MSCSCSKSFSGPNVIDDDYYGDFIGDLTGNVIGNLIGNVTGNVTGNVIGYATGASSVDFFTTDLTANLVITPSGGGSFVAAATEISRQQIFGTDGSVLSFVNLHFVCSSTSGNIFPLTIDYGETLLATQYTEVLVHVTRSNNSKSLSGIIDIGQSNIYIFSSQGLNPHANENWSIQFFIRSQ